MRRTKIGGYKMACHIVAELSKLRRPNRRNNTSGDVFMKESTVLVVRPGGDMAGASAMNTSTLSLSIGWIERVAKACAVP
jgi:hypothetical protein